VTMSRIHRILAAGGLALLASIAAVLLPGFVGQAAAQGAGSQSSLPTTSSPWDPQTTNVPYLAWAGEELRLEKCFADPYLENDPSLSGVGADFLVEDWSGDTSHVPQMEPTTQDVFWSNTLDEPCVSEDIVALYPGMARVEVDVTDPNDVLGFPDSGTSSPIIKHQFLAGWMTLNTPSLTQLSASSFASTAQSEAAAELGDPTGNGEFNAGSKPGYLDVKVTGTMPMDGAWAALVGQPSVTLPTDWPLLANALATDDVATDSQAQAADKWDISNDPTGDLGHLFQTPVNCHAVPSQFVSAPAAPPGTDSVDDCTGGGDDGPFSTQFGILSSNSAIGPFDPVRAGDTLLPNGVLDWADAPMPAARIDVAIAPNSGNATDISGVGYLAAADKAKTYSRDFLGYASDPLADNEYAPFYDQYIPATAAGESSSGVDGGIANNFNGFLVNGVYHNWNIAAPLASAGGGATSCLREAADPQHAYNPSSDFYQQPSGLQSVAVYTDNHGEAQVQYIPGLGYYFNSLIANGSAIPNANGGCDLQSLYQVPDALGTASITATARYPFKPTDYPDVASTPLPVSVASLWSKQLTAYPKGTGTENNTSRIVTSHAQDIDGSPFGHEVVCFYADSNAEGLSVFQGTVGGTSYGGVINDPSFDSKAGQGAVCELSDAYGNAAVEVLDSNSTTVDVTANYENEGILRDIDVNFAGTPTTTTTTTTTTPTTTTPTTTTAAAPASTAGTTSTSTSAPPNETQATIVIKNSLKTRLTLVRLVSPSHGAHRALLKALSTSRTVTVRLAMVERITRSAKHGSHTTRRTVIRTVTVRANHTISITVPSSVIKISAALL
jgi:hypothetical protein